MSEADSRLVADGDSGWLGSASLTEFQSSAGIPLDEQLILIDNPGFFDGFTPLFYPWRSRSLARYALLCLRHRALYHAWRREVGSFVGARRVFLGFFDRSMDRLDLLPSVFAWTARQKPREIELVIGKGDYVFSACSLAGRPENLATIWTNNLDCRDDRVRFLPMGRDFRSVHLFGTMRPSGDKSILCYCNFSVDTHPVREAISRVVREKEFVTCEHMGRFLDYSLTRDDFYEQLKSSKFCLCPRGKAFDTFRMWDALYVGTIPIVVREAAYHDELADLPILFLDTYDQIGELTEEFLVAAYEQMSSEKYNYQKLCRSYWLSGRDRPAGTPPIA